MNLGVLNPKNKNKNSENIDEEKIKSSKIYTTLKKDNENISKDLSVKENELSDFQSKFRNIKDDIFHQKNTINNLSEYIEENKINLPEDSYNKLKSTLVSYDYKVDAMLKYNYNHKQINIEKVNDADFESMSASLDDLESDTSEEKMI